MCHESIGLSLQFPTALLNCSQAISNQALYSQRTAIKLEQFKKAVEDHKEGHLCHADPHSPRFRSENKKRDEVSKNRACCLGTRDGRDEMFGERRGDDGCLFIGPWGGQRWGMERKRGMGLVERGQRPNPNGEYRRGHPPFILPVSFQQHLLARQSRWVSFRSSWGQRLCAVTLIMLLLTTRALVDLACFVWY